MTFGNRSRVIDCSDSTIRNFNWCVTYIQQWKPTLLSPNVDGNCLWQHVMLMTTAYRSIWCWWQLLMAACDIDDNCLWQHVILMTTFYVSMWCWQLLMAACELMTTAYGSMWWWWHLHMSACDVDNNCLLQHLKLMTTAYSCMWCWWQLLMAAYRMLMTTD